MSGDCFDRRVGRVKRGFDTNLYSTLSDIVFDIARYQNMEIGQFFFIFSMIDYW